MLAHRETLKAVIDRIIPQDDYPSASGNGVMEYLSRILSTDMSNHRQWIETGLRAIESESQSCHGKGFTSLDAEHQDQLLGQIEQQRTQATWPIDPAAWFAMLIRLTNEGYYADPGNGGNVSRESWKMVGYEPRREL